MHGHRPRATTADGAVVCVGAVPLLWWSRLQLLSNCGGGGLVVTEGIKACLVDKLTARDMIRVNAESLRSCFWATAAAALAVIVVRRLRCATTSTKTQRTANNGVGTAWRERP